MDVNLFFRKHLVRLFPGASENGQAFVRLYLLGMLQALFCKERPPYPCSSKAVDAEGNQRKLTSLRTVGD